MSVPDMSRVGRPRRRRVEICYSLAYPDETGPDGRDARDGRRGAEGLARALARAPAMRDEDITDTVTVRLHLLTV